jgi:hypothetical protein
MAHEFRGRLCWKARNLARGHALQVVEPGKRRNNSTLSSPSMYKSAMHRVIRIVLLFISALVSAGGMASGQQPSPSPAKPSPAPTPIQLATLPFELQSAATSLQEIDTSLARIQSSADAIAGSLSNMINELDPRMIEDTRLLSTSPALEMLYRIRLSWQKFSESLSASDRELTRFATSLEERLARLDQLNKTWQATLQSAKESDTPPPVLHDYAIISLLLRLFCFVASQYPTSIGCSGALALKVQEKLFLSLQVARGLCVLIYVQR